ncbi:hypothetical protein [Amycolatopsis methanolica]|uniref:hypothetical protein n=1 Tax=Amycolatopsis methanolica TaxID=1814 RepID=UPI001CC240E3|nr:hypothetical protein [Amycolatopsis methanolica]
MFAGVRGHRGRRPSGVARDARPRRAGYLATLRGLPGRYLRFPVLRLAAGRGALWFFAFCAVWAGIAVALSQPPFSYSPERIGLYGAAGLLGIVARRIAGVWIDRIGARRVILIGLALAAAAALTLGLCLPNTPLALVCLGLFDAGLVAAQVANQSTVLALDPAAGAAAVDWFGWTATAVVCAAAIVAAAGITAGSRVGSR